MIGWVMRLWARVLRGPNGPRVGQETYGVHYRYRRYRRPLGGVAWTPTGKDDICWPPCGACDETRYGEMFRTGGA